MHRTVLVAAMLCACPLAALAQEDSVTLNGVTFDFGGPSLPLTSLQQDFARTYINAINSHNATSLLALRDRSYSTCANYGIRVLLHDLQQAQIPANAKLRFFTTKTDFATLLRAADVVYMPVQHTAIFGISFQTATKDNVRFVNILRPVRETTETITIVPYCPTEKSKSLVR
jgi:hypothetical protein